MKKPAPLCRYCGARHRVTLRGALVISGWPIRRDGALHAPERAGSLFVTFCCGDPVCMLNAQRDHRAFFLPLTLLYSESDYAEACARVAAQPWGADPVVTRGLERAHTIAREAPEVLVMGGEIPLTYPEEDTGH